MSLFQSREYQEVFAKHFCTEKDIYWTKYGGFEVVGDKVVFLGMKPVLGKEEVTDYGDIKARDKKQAWEEIIKELRGKGYNKLQLDYVREDSETIQSLKDLHGESLKVMEQEVAPYVDLPDGFDEYLSALKRKHRKELKRKIKRLEEKSSFYQCTKETVKKDFEECVRLHRLSDPDKN